MRDLSASSVVAVPVRANFFNVPDSVWGELRFVYPRGLWWGHDAVSCARRIVTTLQRFITDMDSPVLVALDEGPDNEEAPAGIVACMGERTVVIPMEFRKRRVRVGDTDVFVSRDEGPLHLARAVVAEIAKALKPKRRKASD